MLRSSLKLLNLSLLSQHPLAVEEAGEEAAVVDGEPQQLLLLLQHPAPRLRKKFLPLHVEVAEDPVVDEGQDAAVALKLPSLLMSK